MKKEIKDQTEKKDQIKNKPAAEKVSGEKSVEETTIDETPEEDAESTDSDEETGELEKLRAEKDELHDKYLRLYSEFDNFRRRTAKEKFEIIERANENLLLELLPIIDDFERALASISEASDIKSITKGVRLIFNKFYKALENTGLKEIDCLEKEFDPEVHEAITKIPAPKKKLKGKIVDQIQKGYKLKEKVIRHSKVVVGE